MFCRNSRRRDKPAYGSHNQSETQDRMVKDLILYIIKLGDNSFKILKSIEAVVRNIHSGLLMDAVSFSIPIHNQISPSVSDMEFGEAIVSLATNTVFPAGTESVIDAFASAIVEFPHKQSYYAAFLATLLCSRQETDSFKDEFCSKLLEIPQSAFVKNVKGELMESMAEGSGSDHAFVMYTLMIVRICVQVVELLLSTISKAKNASNLHIVTGGLGFLLSMSGIGIVDSEMVCGLISSMLASNSSDIRCLLAIASGMLYLDHDGFDRHSDGFCQVLDSLKELTLTVDRNIGYGNRFIDVVESLWDAKSNGFVSTNFVLVFDNPKFNEGRKVPQLNLRLPFDTSRLTFNSAFFVYKYATKYESAVVCPAPLFRHPASCVMYNYGDFLSAVTYVGLDSMSAALNVAPLKKFDYARFRIIVEDTIISFASNVETAAQQLLLIPVQHDSFLYVLVDMIFGFIFNRSTSLFGGLVNGLETTGIFAAKLITSLVVLENSLEPIIMNALRQLLKTYSMLPYHSMMNVSEMFAQLISQDLPNLSRLNQMLVDFVEDNEIQCLPPIDGLLSNINMPQDNHIYTLLFATVMMKLYGNFGEERYWELPQQLTAFFNPTYTEDDVFVSKLENPRVQLSEPNAMVIQSNLENGIIDPTNPPEELHIMRSLLRIKITSSWEQTKLIREVVNFLCELEGKPFAASADDLNIDAILFPAVSGVKRSMNDTEDTEVKRFKEVVKSDQEVIDAEDDFEASGPAVQIDDVDALGLDDIDVENSLLMPHICTLQDVGFRWCKKTISVLAAYALIGLGSRTFTHFLRMSELYGAAIAKWGTVASNELDNAMMQTVLALHRHDYRRADCVMAHLVVRGLLSIDSVVQFMVSHSCTYYYQLRFHKLYNLIITNSLMGLPQFVDAAAIATISSQPDQYAEPVAKAEVSDSIHVKRHVDMQGYVTFQTASIPQPRTAIIGWLNSLCAVSATQLDTKRSSFLQSIIRSL